MPDPADLERDPLLTKLSVAHMQIIIYTKPGIP